MENNKEFNKEKFDSLYQEVFNEISNEFEFKESVNKFRKTQFSYLSNLDKFFHKKCPKEFEWIEKNSTFVNGQMKPKENVDNKEFDIKVNELNDCIMKNDKGLTSSVADFEKEFMDFNENINKEMKECFKLKNDNDIKVCIKDKLMKNSNNLIGMFNKYETIFDNLNKAIKL